MSGFLRCAPLTLRGGLNIVILRVVHKAKSIFPWDRGGLAVVRQLADVFGRHQTMQLALAIMIIGSIMCATTHLWAILLLGRALQGVAVAALTSVVSTILADRVSLQENAKINSMVQLIAGTAYAYGPIVGGFLTKVNWRWCFWISVPISGVASLINFLLLRQDLVAGTHSLYKSPMAGIRKLDVFGAGLFIASISMMILATTWGGATYPWTSYKVLVPLIIGAVVFCFFIVYERLFEPGKVVNKRLSQQSAMIPHALFARLDVIWLLIVQFAAGTALYSIFYYLSIYYIFVQGSPPSQAGLNLLWYIIGIASGVAGASFSVNVYPASTYLPLVVGTWAEAVGIGLVAYATHKEDHKLLIAMTVIAGFGTGTRFMPCGLMMTGFWPTKRAQALSLMRFAMPFGGTIGLAIMGSVFNNKLAALRGTVDTSDLNPFSLFNGKGGSNSDVLAGLAPPEVALIQSQAKTAVTWAFISIIPILAISCVTSLLLGNVWIRTTHVQNTGTVEPTIGQKLVANASTSLVDSSLTGVLGNDTEKARAAPTTTHTTVRDRHASYVLHEPYLLALLKGREYLNSRRKLWYPDSDGVDVVDGD